MNYQISAHHLQALSEALSDLRDTWVRVSLQLKDEVADQPSPARDEVLLQVERHLARIREGERGLYVKPPGNPQ